MTVISIVAHRGGTEATLRAGNSLPWLAGSFTGRSVHQTRSVEGAGGGRWRQKTGLEHRLSSNWRERWWVMKGKKMLYIDLSRWLGFRILRWCVWARQKKIQKQGMGYYYEEKKPWIFSEIKVVHLQEEETFLWIRLIQRKTAHWFGRADGCCAGTTT